MLQIFASWNLNNFFFNIYSLLLTLISFSSEKMFVVVDTDFFSDSLLRKSRTHKKEEEKGSALGQKEEE